MFQKVKQTSAAQAARHITPCIASKQDNEDFLLHYGFVPPGNPNDGVLLFPSIDAALDWYLNLAAPPVVFFCMLPLVLLSLTLEGGAGL